MAKYKVIMNERQKDGSIHKIEQIAICQNPQQVIEFYGLREPDIVSFLIEPIVD